MIPLAQSSGGGGLLTLLIFVVPFGLLFVFMRNQQRRVRQQQALQQSAEVGRRRACHVREDRRTQVGHAALLYGCLSHADRPSSTFSRMPSAEGTSTAAEKYALTR